MKVKASVLFGARSGGLRGRAPAASARPGGLEAPPPGPEGLEAPPSGSGGARTHREYARQAPPSASEIRQETYTPTPS